MMQKLSTMFLAVFFALSFSGYAFAQGDPTATTARETKALQKRAAEETKTAEKKAAAQTKAAEKKAAAQRKAAQKKAPEEKADEKK